MEEGEDEVGDKNVAIHCLNWKVKKKEGSTFNLAFFLNLNFKV